MFLPLACSFCLIVLIFAFITSRGATIPSIAAAVPVVADDLVVEDLLGGAGDGNDNDGAAAAKVICFLKKKNMGICLP